MNAARLVAHYERIADAPYAMQRLRRFILDLAVRGKLVPHDPRDEPASELLKRIAAEKARLVKAGEFREPSSSMQIKRDDLPFVPAPHWVWARLIEIARPSYGFAFSSAQFNSSKRGMPLIRIRDISSTDAEAYFEGDYDPAYLVKTGDYLVGMDGEFNLRRWNGRDSLLNQRVMRLNGWRCEVDAAYVTLPLQSILDHLHGETSLTTVKHLSAKQVNGIEIPLPPLAEQRRIVAKVGELMALCDRLEVVRAERETTRDRLAASSLARLNSPDPDTYQDDARFVLNALPTLTTRPDQIKQLRQTILNLAVRGKLAPQDPKDEPASELLKRIAKEKARRVQEREIRQRDVQPPIASDEAPFQLPHSWVWTRLGTVCFLITDGAHHTPKYVDEGVPFLSVKDVSGGTIDFSGTRFISEEAHRELAKRCKPELGDILLTKVGTTGIAVNINVDREFSIFVSLALLKFSQENIDRRYLCNLINSPFVKKQSADNTQGIGNKNLVLRLINQFLIPLPPLAEQERIVDKVAELMALCDRLEASLDTADNTRRRLLDALLAEALAPSELREMVAVA
jgi:type I restriction enzyme S subunit